MNPVRVVGVVVVVVGLLLLLPLAFRSGRDWTRASGKATVEDERVVRVVDGDTVELSNGETVRLLGLDTPEVYGGVECWGREASDHLRKLLPVGAPVTVEVIRDPDGPRRDRYGRLLAWLLLVDGRSVSTLMVSAGAGPVYSDSRGYGDASGVRLDEVLAAEAEAAKVGAGGWSACGWEVVP